jgi:hypothetical protein
VMRTLPLLLLAFSTGCGSSKPMMGLWVATVPLVSIGSFTIAERGDIIELLSLRWNGCSIVAKHIPIRSATLTFEEKGPTNFVLRGAFTDSKTFQGTLKVESCADQAQPNVLDAAEYVRFGSAEVRFTARAMSQ